MIQTPAGTRATGFTLLELLVAVAVFAVIGAMAYGGLQKIMDQQQRTTVHAQRLADLQLAYRIMQRDFEQMLDRQIRNEYGDSVAALVGGSGYEGVAFSRAGYPNPAGFLRSEIQRVSYVADQEQLLRRSWRVLDRAQDSLPDEEALIEDINEFAIRFLDESDEWQANWPAQQTQGQTAPALPRAIEVQVDLVDLGVIRWLFRVPENYQVPAAPDAAPGSGKAGEGEDENPDQDA